MTLRRLRPVLLILACVAATPCLYPQSSMHLPVLNRIPVDGIGFEQASPRYFAARIATETLDFIDEDHLLFTFHHSALLERRASAQGETDEEAVRAVILSLPTNTVSAPADWNVPSHGAYLWPLPGGRFLLHDDAGLRLLDGRLASQPFLALRDTLVFLTLSPNKKRVELQTRDGERSIQLQVLDMASKAVVQQAGIKAPADLPITDDGILTATTTLGNAWDLEDRSFAGKTQHLATIASTCAPAEKVLGPDQLLVVSCRSSSGRDLQILSMGGRQLWSGRWNEQDAWPVFALAQGAQTIALSVIHPRPSSEAGDADEVTRGTQELKVFHPGNSNPVARGFIVPAMSDERNFALSPTGHKLAILTAGTVTVYQLP